MKPDRMMTSEDASLTARCLLLLLLVAAIFVALAFAHANEARGEGVSLRGVVGPLADKAREIIRTCGSRVVSARSRRGNRSNHPIGRAVDLKGNPKCIYGQLAKWPGGVSTDYASAPGGPHVHISYNPGGQEWGLRFSHRRPNRMFAAYAETKAVRE